MKKTVERIKLSSGFDVSRVIIGLWQIADMERDGAALATRAPAGHCWCLATKPRGAADVGVSFGRPNAPRELV